MIDYMHIIGERFPDARCHTTGNTYEDIVWNTPPIPKQELEEAALLSAQETRRADINNKRAAVFSGGFFDTNGIRWSSTPTDIANINAVCTLIAVGAVTGPQVWRDADDVDHALSPTELIGLAAQMAVFGKMCYVASWQHKHNIENLTNISDVLDYDITTNWPT